MTLVHHFVYARFLLGVIHNKTLIRKRNQRVIFNKIGFFDMRIPTNEHNFSVQILLTVKIMAGFLIYPFVVCIAEK